MTRPQDDGPLETNTAIVDGRAAVARQPDWTHWVGRTHTWAHARLIEAGWRVCGAGDWAVTLRSPDGLLAARVCPFDPAYPVYTRLCRRLAGHPRLPRVHADIALDGGGQLTIMDFLTPVPAGGAETVRARWDDGTDPLLAQVRRAAEELSDTAAGTIAWWNGIDLNAGNIMRDTAGEIKLVDIFCLDGPGLYTTLRSDPATVARRIPAGQRRHMLDIAAVVRESSREELAALRAGAAVAGWDG